MSRVIALTFNAFQENTYLVCDDSGSAVVIDPGCHSSEEQRQFREKVDLEEVRLESIINTHCHVDHVFGNKFVYENFCPRLLIPQGEEPLLQSYPQVANMYGLPADPSPEPTGYLEHLQKLNIGDTTLEIFSTPGHSPASVSLYCEKDGYILGGDVLFQGSIGRTDLPGGNHSLLLESIHKYFLSLPDNVIVYPGHGPFTTIGTEKTSNPFLTNA